MKEKLKSAQKSLVQLISRIWGFTKRNAVPLMVVNSFVVVSMLMTNNSIALSIAWSVIQGALLVAWDSQKKSESGKIDQLKNVRRMTKRTKAGIVVKPEDIQSAIAVLADLEDYMGK